MKSNNTVRKNSNKFIGSCGSVKMEPVDCETIDLIESDSDDENPEESSEPCQKKLKTDVKIEDLTEHLNFFGTNTLVSTPDFPKIENDIFEAMFVNDTTAPMEYYDDQIPKQQDLDDNAVGRIRVRDLQTMMTDETLTRYQAGSDQLLTEPHLSLNRVKELYSKYFTKRSQENIVIIANVLNMICLSKNVLESRSANLYEAIFAEQTKVKLLNDASKIHDKHRQILEGELRSHIFEVLSVVGAKDFVYTFRMFMLSILIVMRALDKPKFEDKAMLFQDLVLLLLNALLNCSQQMYQQIFAMLLSKSLRQDVSELATTIQEGHNRCSVSDHLRLFFVSTVETRCFQNSIKTVMSDMGTNLLREYFKLGLSNFRISSTLVEPVQEKAPPDTQPSDSVLHYTDTMDESNETYKLVPMPNESSSQPCALVNYCPATSSQTTLTNAYNYNPEPTTLVTPVIVPASETCHANNSTIQVATAKTMIQPIGVKPNKIQVRRKRESNSNKQTQTTTPTRSVNNRKPPVLNMNSGFNQQVTSANCGINQSVTIANESFNSSEHATSVTPVLIPELGTCFVNNSDIQAAKSKTVVQPIGVKPRKIRKKRETNSNEQAEISNCNKKRAVKKTNSGINQSVTSTDGINSKPVTRQTRVKKNKIQVRRKRETKSNEKTHTTKRIKKKPVLNINSDFNQQVASTNCGANQSVTIVNEDFNNSEPTTLVTPVFVPELGTCQVNNSDIQVATPTTINHQIGVKPSKIQVRRKRESNSNQQTQTTTNRNRKQPVINTNSGFNQQMTTTNYGANQSVTIVNGNFNNSEPTTLVDPVFVPELGTCQVNNSDIQVATPKTVNHQMGVKPRKIQVRRKQESNSNQQTQTTTNRNRKRPVLNINSGFNQQVTSTSCGANQSVTIVNGNFNNSEPPTLVTPVFVPELGTCYVNNSDLPVTTPTTVNHTNFGFNQQVTSTKCGINQSITIANGSFNSSEHATLVTPVFIPELGTCFVKNSDIQAATATTMIQPIGIEPNKIQVPRKQETNSNQQTHTFNHITKQPVININSGFNQQMTTTNYGANQSVTIVNGNFNRSEHATLVTPVFIPELGTCLVKNSDIQAATATTMIQPIGVEPNKIEVRRKQETNSNQQTHTFNHITKQPVININSGFNQQMTTTNYGANQSVTIVNGNFNRSEPATLVTPVFIPELGTCLVKNSDIQAATATTMIQPIGVEPNKIEVRRKQETNSNQQTHTFNHITKQPVININSGFNQRMTTTNYGANQSVTIVNGNFNRSEPATLVTPVFVPELETCLVKNSDIQAATATTMIQPIGVEPNKIEVRRKQETNSNQQTHTFNHITKQPVININSGFNQQMTTTNYSANQSVTIVNGNFNRSEPATLVTPGFVPELETCLVKNSDIQAATATTMIQPIGVEPNKIEVRREQETNSNQQTHTFNHITKQPVININSGFNQQMTTTNYGANQSVTIVNGNFNRSEPATLVTPVFVPELETCYVNNLDLPVTTPTTVNHTNFGFNQQVTSTKCGINQSVTIANESFNSSEHATSVTPVFIPELGTCYVNNSNIQVATRTNVNQQIEVKNNAIQVRGKSETNCHTQTETLHFNSGFNQSVTSTICGSNQSVTNVSCDQPSIKVNAGFNRSVTISLPKPTPPVLFKLCFENGSPVYRNICL